MNKIIKISDGAKQALAIGRRNRCWFRVWGAMGIIPQPVYEKGWWSLPYDPDINISEKVPKRALKRAEILKSNMPVKQMILVHEAPLLLCAPAPKKIELPQADELVKALVQIAGMSLLVLVSLFGLAFTTAAYVDPVLICVLEDGTWIEVMRWLQE